MAERDRIARELSRDEKNVVSVGWYCGNCKNWHAPHIDTCPKAPVDNRTLGERIRSANNG